jgi:SAM-dependent methyltransferase
VSYAPGFTDDVRGMLDARRADEHAAFLLEHLSSGDRVLDAGCGPGAITLGLAQAVGPHGLVVGVDAEPSQVEAARRAAHAAGVVNVRFEVGRAESLARPDAAFDAALAHGLIEHLAEPLTAVRELRRVVRPGGLVALCSSDWSGARVEPSTPDVVTALAAHRELRREAGGDPDAGARLATLAHEAGLEVVSESAELRADLGYAELARYVGRRLAAAGRRDEAAAASRWLALGEGTFEQRWVSVLARATRR